MNAITNFDLGVLDAIRENLSCAFLDTVLPFITRFADHGIGWIVVAVVLLLFKKTRKTGLTVGAALIIGLVIGNMTLKPLIARVRPYDLPGKELIRDALLVAPLSDFSFPSGHTLASFEAATVLMIRDKKLGIPALILAFIIAFSRLYLYVHYFTDVVAGLLLGVLFGALGYLIVKKCFDLYEKKKAAKKAE